jgi:hypothetical protein
MLITIKKTDTSLPKRRRMNTPAALPPSFRPYSHRRREQQHPSLPCKEFQTSPFD